MLLYLSPMDLQALRHSREWNDQLSGMLKLLQMK
jgi:hypothetical protein